MHNLEGFGFRSDCFSLKDNLNYMSLAFQGPKPGFNHQIFCHGPRLCVCPTVPRLLESALPGEWEPTAAAAPLQQCVKLLLIYSLQHVKDGNPVACKQERRTSTIFPSHSPLAMNNCFIFAAFVLLGCKNPNNYVVSDIKRHKSKGDHFQTAHKGSSVPRWSREILCLWVLLQVEGMKLGNAVISSL